MNNPEVLFACWRSVVEYLFGAGVVLRFLFGIMRSSSLSHEKKIAAAVFMAVKICSMLATMLEFRSLFDGIVDSTDARTKKATFTAARNGRQRCFMSLPWSSKRGDGLCKH